MATAKPANIDELFECPVCFHSYTNPRILHCGHQYCLECLEPLVIKKPPAQDNITCPTCRYDTPIKPGDEATDLPRPVLMNEVQGALQNLIGPSKKTVKKDCGWCESEDKVSTSYCYQCQTKMCDNCQSDHEKDNMFEGHKSVVISDNLFCSNHDNVVTVFCHECKYGMCPKCAGKDHRKHKTEDIHVMACQSRVKVTEFIEAQQATSINQTVFANIKTKVQELQQSQDNIVTKISRIIYSLKSLESKLEHIRNEVLSKTSADIKTLKLYEADLGGLDTSRTSLIELGQYLIEKASDPELVLKAMELPTASTIRDTTQPPTINRPAEHKLNQLETDLSKWMNSCNINYERDSLAGGTIEIYNKQSAVTSSRDGYVKIKEPVNTFLLKHHIESRNGVWAVAFNSSLSQLAVRTSDENAPIKVYNLACTLIKGFGKGIQGLSEDKGLYIDHHRHLYLFPCGEHLTTIDMEGKVYDVIKVKGSDLKGVTYCDTSDQYIVTDVNNHSVVIIDAKSRKVVSSFGSRGHGDNQLQYPGHVCVGDIGGRATIVVSDRDNNAVKLFELTGRHVKTYGSEGSGDTQLSCPEGVAVDPAGRVIVCDYNNNRVVSFWEDGNVDHWGILLSGEELGGYPTAIVIDSINKLVAICSSYTGSFQLYTHIII